MTDYNDEQPTLFDMPPAPNPARFDCVYTDGEWPTEIDCPKQQPRTAIFIGYLEWSWSPANSRIESYYLSTNRRHTHWILWGSIYDAEHDDYKQGPQAYCPKKGVTAKTAAVNLILTAWQGEITTYRSEPLEPFHGFSEGLLSGEELHALLAEMTLNVADIYKKFGEYKDAEIFYRFFIKTYQGYDFASEVEKAKIALEDL